MGLLEDWKGPLTALDKPAVLRLLEAMQQQEIATAMATQGIQLLRRRTLDATARRGLREHLEQANAALEDSPLPDKEWKRMLAILEPALLTAVLNVSSSSVGRYAARLRATPDDVAARLHYVAMVVADLLGGYNELGVRRWFARKRKALAGKSPLAVLRGAWDPDDEGPERVRALARSLTGSPAT
jgi:hypothetical protein